MNFRLVVFFIICSLSAHSQSKILFSRSSGGLNTGGTLDLMMYDPVKKTTKLLLKGTVNRRGEYNPVTSPDKKKIIFNTYKFSGWKLGVGDFKDNKVSNIKKFTSRSNYEYCAKYSPDGLKIAYQEYSWGKRASSIYISDKNGDNAKLFFESKISDQGLDWTLDNKSIVFTSPKDNKLAVYLRSLDGKLMKMLSIKGTNCFASSTSKTENRIAFLSDKDGEIDLYIRNLDGSGLKNLTSNLKTTKESEDSFWAYKTSWSPDGKKIVFNVKVDGDFELFIINVDGTNLTQITKNKDTDITPFWTN